MNDPVSSIIGDFSGFLEIPEVTMQLLIGTVGLILLGVGFHRHKDGYSQIFSALGWPFIGLFFYLYSGYFVEIEDPVLVLMTAGALPASIAMSYWEWTSDGSSIDTIVWARGFVVWSMIPYYVVFGIPHLNMAFVQFTAVSAELLLEFAGLGGYEIGPMMIERYQQNPIPVSEWDGSRFVLSEPLGEGGFYAPMANREGDNVVSFILACSALQSMAVFIGAIVALSSVHWKRRARALLIAIPTIHILNVFRNAGIVWLTDAYGTWTLFGGPLAEDMGIFDFAHSYAAKVASLFAMFLMAIALFDLLPELHKHVMRVMRPFTSINGSKEPKSNNS